MRAFVTGGTGFLGGTLCAQLAAEGHEVVALARAGSRSEALERLGARLARGDITDRASLREPMKGVGAVFHVAAWYELGVSDAARMQAVNVEGARNVLETAADAGVPCIVHVSSVAALGPTGDRVADERHQHPGEFGSIYERTKHEAHLLARALAARGAPVRIASPGTIFGKGDHSLVALLVKAHLSGLLRARFYPGLAMSLVDVEDCAAGLRLVASRGVNGGEYNLVGCVITMGEWVERMADLTGLAAPKLTLPPRALKAGAKLFPLVAGALGLAPGTAAEGLALADGKAWAFSSERARRELGWTPRDFDESLARTLIAFDRGGGARFRPKTGRARAALERARAGR